VDENTGDVAAINWEMAGLWPDLWEYEKALFGGQHRSWWLDIIVSQTMPCYSRKVEIDSELEALWKSYTSWIDHVKAVRDTFPNRDDGGPTDLVTV
jgi:hypothetical protein